MNDKERMVYKSGLIPASGFQSPAALREQLQRNAQEYLDVVTKTTPPPEPPKPAAQPAAPQAAATPASAEPQPPADVVTVGDLRKEIYETAVRVMQAMPEKFRGPVGPKGDPGQNISAEALRRVIAEEIERAISANSDRFRGQPGQSIGIDDVKKLVAEAVKQLSRRIRSVSEVRRVCQEKIRRFPARKARQSSSSATSLSAAP